MLIFLVKNNEKSLPKKSEKFWSWKIGEKKCEKTLFFRREKKCEKTLFFRREKKMWKTLFFRREKKMSKNPIFQERKKMWKNPIFQERKKNVKNPIFEERKKNVKNPIFQERKKNVKNPIFQERKKNVKNPIFQERKKNIKKPYFSGGEKKKTFARFKNFLSWNIKYFDFVTKKIFGRKILSVWKKSLHKKKVFSRRYLATSWLFFSQKKKKKFFFFRGPKILKRACEEPTQSRDLTTSQAFYLYFWKVVVLRKKFFSRALTKRLTAILRPFLESSGSHKKSFL